MDKLRKKFNLLKKFGRKKIAYKKLRNSASLDSLLPSINQSYKSFSQPDLSFNNPVYGKQKGKGRKQRVKRRKLHNRKHKRQTPKRK